MTSDLRIVIDTNVVVSAVLLPRSIPRLAFDRAVDQGRLLASEATIDELEDVLRRPKFDRYLREQKRLEFLAELVRHAELIEVAEFKPICRDPKDDKYLALALSGKASQIISGDADLLTLHPFRGIEIVTPQQFLASVERPKG